MSDENKVMGNGNTKSKQPLSHLESLHAHRHSALACSSSLCIILIRCNSTEIIVNSFSTQMLTSCGVKFLLNNYLFSFRFTVLNVISFLLLLLHIIIKATRSRKSKENSESNNSLKDYSIKIFYQ